MTADMLGADELQLSASEVHRRRRTSDAASHFLFLWSSLAVPTCSPQENHVQSPLERQLASGLLLS